MSTLTYTPDDDVKVHEEGAIRLICKAYQSHEDGLPEWLKNSADAYARQNATQDRRVIVLIFDQGRRDAKASVSCLDFCGMTSSNIEQDFRIWADPEAARRGGRSSAVQGGHGNGGKCYMTQMFEDFAVIQTVKAGKGSRYGVTAGSVKFGYVPDRARGRDFVVKDLRGELGEVLRPTGCSIKGLPEAAQAALDLADGFTLIRGVGPKGYSARIPVAHLVNSLEEHPQMIMTLQLCKVYVVVNGEPWGAGRPITLPEIPPMEGAEQPRVIAIPGELKDPVSGERVPTTGNGSSPTGALELRTSNVSMRWSRKGRHAVVYRAKSGFIGYDAVSALDIQSPYRDRIYGGCYLEALEPYKQNDRGPLARSPLTRAVQRFVAEQIESYAKEFEALERHRYRQEERNALSKMNEALDRWKNRFLNDLMQGLWGPGEGTVVRPTTPPLPAGKPARLEVTLSHPRAGVGISFKPSVKFYDHQRRQIRAVPYRWVSDDTNVAMVDEDLAVVNTFSYGRTTITAETLDGKLRSNTLPLEVVRILEIRIVPAELTVSTGTRHKLEAVCKLSTGDETSDIYLEWIENNPGIARVSSAGLVYAFAPGQTEVLAADDRCVAKAPATVKVVAEEGRAGGERRGRGYPRVLVSGEIDHDPDTGAYVHFSRDDPPVAQRPQDADRNIWWINSSAPLARLYLDTSKEYGYQSREWRMYHLERYIDVIVQIALTHGPEGSVPLSPNDWILKWGSHVSEIQAAVATDLSDFIAHGQLPGE